MIAYHISRTNAFQEGSVVNLIHPSADKNTEEIINQRFPEGLSHHGLYHFTRHYDLSRNHDSLIENIFEYERCLNFPHRFSRFQSFFANETIEDAKYWLEFFSEKNKCTIWEVEFDHDNYMKLDSSW